MLRINILTELVVRTSTVELVIMDYDMGHKSQLFLFWHLVIVEQCRVNVTR